VSDAWEAL